MAAARSRHASKEELAEAKQRLKEIEEELKQIQLQPETKMGEEREMRYARVLRLRAMRDEFQSQFPIEQPSRASNLVLALVMTVASFMLCAFCAAGGYVAIHVFNQKPSPVDTVNAFMNAMESSNYSTAWQIDFSPTLREQLTLDSFEQQAKKADTTYGTITGYALAKQTGDFQQTGTYTFTITRTKATYTVVIQMLLFHNSWGISDLGNTVNPVAAGVGGGATATPTGTSGYSTTPTSTSSASGTPTTTP
jgi:hypothetical protein